MKSKFENAYLLNLSEESDGDYPKIEHDDIDKIDEWDTLERKKIEEQKDGQQEEGKMLVEKYTEEETLLGKRILLKLRSSIVVDISKVGNEYYLYRVAGSAENAQKEDIQLDGTVNGKMLDSKIVADIF